MRQYRHLTAYVLGVLAVLATIVLTTPGTGTDAAWVDRQSFAVPALAMGGLDVALTAAGDAARLDNASAADLEYRPAAVEVRPAAGSVPGDVADFLGTGPSIAYRTGATGCSGTTGRWGAVVRGAAGTPVTSVGGGPRDPLPAGEHRPLCLSVATTASERDVLLASAGRTFDVVTTLETVSAGTGSWSRAHDWTVPHTVGFPPAQRHPQRHLACTTARWTETATLRWAWPDSSVTDPVATPAVHRWSLMVRRVGTADWTEVRSGSGDLRALGVSRSELPGNGEYQAMIRAYPSAASDTYVDSADLWSVTRSANFWNRLSCGTVTAAPGAGAAGVDGVSR